MNLEAPPRPYIDMLRDELADYERRIAKAAQLLHDQPEYYALVLRGLEYSIGVVRAKIARELEHAAPIQS